MTRALGGLLSEAAKGATIPPMRNKQKTVALTIPAAPLSPTVTPLADGKKTTPVARGPALFRAGYWSSEQ